MYTHIYSLFYSHMVQWVKNPPPLAKQKMQVQSLGQEDPLEKQTATHASILAWRIPRTEEPGGLQATGCVESDTTGATKRACIHSPINRLVDHFHTSAMKAAPHSNAEPQGRSLCTPLLGTEASRQQAG